MLGVALMLVAAVMVGAEAKTAACRRKRDEGERSQRKLEDVPTLLPILEDLGRKHVAYGVAKEHYAIIGQACPLPRKQVEWKQAWCGVSSTQLCAISGILWLAEKLVQSAPQAGWPLKKQVAWKQAW